MSGTRFPVCTRLRRRRTECRNAPKPCIARTIAFVARRDCPWPTSLATQGSSAGAGAGECYAKHAIARRTGPTSLSGRASRTTGRRPAWRGSRAFRGPGASQEIANAVGRRVALAARSGTDPAQVEMLAAAPKEVAGSARPARSAHGRKKRERLHGCCDRLRNGLALASVGRHDRALGQLLGVPVRPGSIAGALTEPRPPAIPLAGCYRPVTCLSVESSPFSSGQSRSR
jgi:hypothetical protein